MGFSCFKGLFVDADSVFAGQSYVKRLYGGGIGIHGKKGRSQFHVAVTNVATEINSVEQVFYTS